MLLRNREAKEFVATENLPLDFPTEEELLAALDASLVALPVPLPTAARPECSVAVEPELAVEPEFMLDFATFLLARLQRRTSEMRQAQCQLSDELARLRFCR